MRTHSNNLFKVYKFTVEHNTVTGKFKAASGVAISKSLKEAKWVLTLISMQSCSLKEAKKEANNKVWDQLEHLGCEVDGGTLILKGQKVLYCSYDSSPESIIKATRDIGT